MSQNLTKSQSQENAQPWGKLISSLATLDSIVLYKPVIKIGRGVGCDIVIDKNKILSNDTNISKEHCVLTKEQNNNNIYIIDTSKNGTFLNGVKIGRNNKRILKNYDKIALVKDANVYIFQTISVEELPDTLTSGSSLESPMLPTKVNITIWGRLISCLLHLPSFDLYNHDFKVGRSSVCDAVIDNMQIDPVIKNRFSKEHFVISRNPGSSVAYITDHSTCGTYLNGRLIGKNKMNILQDNDTISIGQRKTRVYVYKSMLASEANYLPPALRKKYEISNLLGKGACGEVRLAYEKHTCKMYAIKKILKGRSTTSQLHKLNHPSKIENEVKILESLSHPFVVHMKEIVETSDEVFLVLEYMEGGELSNRILMTKRLTESNAKFLFYQMVLAVQFLHMKGITHRDLKPENVLLASQDTETRIKVSDFGLSKVTEEEDMMRTVCGTFHYMAPEVLNNKIPEYDKQVDVWSLGVILFYMLSQTLPFKSANREILAQLIITGAYHMDEVSWKGISYEAKDLVRRMLTVDPQERITISGILSHPWLVNDMALVYKIKELQESEENSETSEDMSPPSKRCKLSSSDESA